MVKKIASKKTKKLILETEIRSKSLNKADYTSSWQGRIFIVNKEKSEIGQKLGVSEEGEYAIKIR